MKNYEGKQKESIESSKAHIERGIEGERYRHGGEGIH